MPKDRADDYEPFRVFPFRAGQCCERVLGTSCRGPREFVVWALLDHGRRTCFMLCASCLGQYEALRGTGNVRAMPITREPVVRARLAPRRPWRRTPARRGIRSPVAQPSATAAA